MVLCVHYTISEGYKCQDVALLIYTVHDAIIWNIIKLLSKQTNVWNIVYVACTHSENNCKINFAQRESFWNYNLNWHLIKWLKNWIKRKFPFKVALNKPIKIYIDTRLFSITPISHGKTIKHSTRSRIYVWQNIFMQETVFFYHFFQPTTKNKNEKNRLNWQSLV